MLTRDALQPESLKAALRTTRVGRRIHCLTSTTSTNDEAWRMVDEGNADGVVILADHQSAGRGRFRRAWHAPRGSSLLMSVALRAPDAEDQGPWLGLVAGVAMWDAVRAVTALMSVIKWPNDLLLRGKKVGGVLVESRHAADGARWHVVGMGINCLQHRGHFPEELAGSATSLEIESPDVISRQAVALELITSLDAWVGSPDGLSCDAVRRAWLDRAGSIGASVVLSCDGMECTGTMIDVDPQAALIVKLHEGGVRAFAAANTTMIDMKQ